MLFPSLSSAKDACYRQEYIIGIDIGHTRANSGATSARGVPEFEFNLRMAQELLVKLGAAGYLKTVLINGDGAIGSLAQRTREANAIPVNLFISIHHDSVQPKYLSTWEYDGRKLNYSDHFRGFSIFTSGKNGAVQRSLVLAEYLGDALLAAQFKPTLHHAEPIPGENRKLLDESRGIYAFDDLAVLKNTLSPAVLLECGVIKHREEEAALNDTDYRERMADAIVAAIEDYCVHESSHPPE